MKSKNLKGKRRRKQLSRWSAPQNPNKGFLRPETWKQEKEETIPQRMQALRKPGFSGIVSSLLVRVKIGINRQPHFFEPFVKFTRRYLSFLKQHYP